METYDKIRKQTRNLWYNYPSGVSTFGSCVNKCGKSARGSGECADCCEKNLAALTTPEMAAKYHKLVRDIRLMEQDFDCWDH